MAKKIALRIWSVIISSFALFGMNVPSMSYAIGRDTPKAVKELSIKKSEKPKLFLKQAYGDYTMIAAHRSHRSHSSHRSHASHRSHYSHRSATPRASTSTPTSRPTTTISTTSTTTIPVINEKHYTDNEKTNIPNASQATSTIIPVLTTSIHVKIPRIFNSAETVKIERVTRDGQLGTADGRYFKLEGVNFPDVTTNEQAAWRAWQILDFLVRGKNVKIIPRPNGKAHIALEDGTWVNQYMAKEGY